jgi:alpha-galactosidase
MSEMSRRGFLGTASVLGLAFPARASFRPSKEGAAGGNQVYVKLDPLAEWDAHLGFALEPPVREWQPQPSEDKNQAVFLGQGFRLKLDFARPDARLTTLQFHLSREDGQPFTVHGYSVSSRLIFTDIYRVWDYRSGPSETDGEFAVYLRDLASGEKYAQTYAANTGIPLIVCTDREGHNRYAFGLLDQVEAAGLRINNYSLGLSQRGEGLNFQFAFERPVGYTLKRSELVDGAYFDARGIDWFHTIQEYAEWTERAGHVTALKPPPAAFEPIWNSWYPLGFNITQESIGKIAELCQKVGIKNVSIDSGYQNHLTGGLGTPQEIETFADYTGDWAPNKDKFPDFRKLVEQIHLRGQLATIWVALFMVGKKTSAYREVSHMLRHDASGKEVYKLCPRHHDTPGYLARTFSQFAKDYDLDGFWLDFMDDEHVPCHTSHPHFTDSTGEGYNACLAAVRDALMKYKPNFLIETRMGMANINAKQFANVLETIDMPFDLDVNRSLGTIVRSFSKGVASKIDPIQWHIRESVENVAVCCATVTFTGVPVFGVDFRLLPEAHLRVVAAWMRFYGEHQNELSQGEFGPVGFDHLFPLLRVQGGTKSFLYAGSSATAPASVEGSDEIYIVNASSSGRVAVFLDGIGVGPWRAISRNCYLEQVSETRIEVRANTFALDMQISKGGLVELRKSQSG